MNVRPNATYESPPVAVRVGTLRRWFDTSTAAPVDPSKGDRIDWLRASPFVVMHLACIGVVWTGVSPVAIAVAVHCMRSGCSPLRRSTTATSRIARSVRRAPCSSSLPWSVRAACSGGRCGGRRIIAITIGIPTRRSIPIPPASTVSCGVTWAGSSRPTVSAPRSHACRTWRSIRSCAGWIATTRRFPSSSPWPCSV